MQQTNFKKQIEELSSIQTRGQYLKFLRMRKGLTQKKCAEHVGVTKTNYYMWVRGKTGIKDIFFNALCDFLMK